MSNDRSRQFKRQNKRLQDVQTLLVLLVGADVNRGSMNLATQPRAGNISSDMRAGTAG